METCLLGRLKHQAFVHVIMGVAELLRCKVPPLVILLHLCLFNEACDDAQARLICSSSALNPWFSGAGQSLCRALLWQGRGDKGYVGGLAPRKCFSYVNVLKWSTKAGFVGHGMDLNMDASQGTFDFLKPAGFLLDAQLLQTCGQNECL